MVDNVHLLLKQTFPGAQFPPVPIKNPPPESTKGKKQNNDDDVKMEVIKTEMDSEETTVSETTMTTEATLAVGTVSTINVEKQTITTTTVGEEQEEDHTLLGKRNASELSEEVAASSSSSSGDHKKTKAEIVHDNEPPSEPPLPDVEPVVYPPLSFCVLFKARNNNAFVKNAVHKDVASVVPTFMKADYKKSKVSFFTASLVLVVNMLALAI